MRYATSQGLQVRTKAPGQGWLLQAQWKNMTLANHDQLGAQALSDGRGGL
ncbi:MAG: hypothetical protein R2911_01000 [Caldilineaceae bacterium]